MYKRPQRLAKNTTDLVPKNASCKRWDTPDDVRVERHARYPSAEWVQASERSGAVLCHSPLPRGTPQVRKRVADIFYYRKYFL
jgi:hypothetical protein